MQSFKLTQIWQRSLAQSEPVPAKLALPEHLLDPVFLSDYCKLMLTDQLSTDNQGFVSLACFLGFTSGLAKLCLICYPDNHLPKCQRSQRSDYTGKEATNLPAD